MVYLIFEVSVNKFSLTSPVLKAVLQSKEA